MKEQCTASQIPPAEVSTKLLTSISSEVWDYICYSSTSLSQIQAAAATCYKTKAYRVYVSQLAELTKLNIICRWWLHFPLGKVLIQIVSLNLKSFLGHCLSAHSVASYRTWILVSWPGLKHDALSHHIVVKIWFLQVVLKIQNASE